MTVNPWNSATLEFVGGPADGRLLTVRTNYMGRPPHEMSLPVTPPLSLVIERESVYPTFERAVYRGTGVMSDERHTWLYEYRGIRS